MRIPDQLLTQVTLFVSDHFNEIHFIGTAADVGVACGHEAAAWIALNPLRHELVGLNHEELVCWCERYGKHLATFYLQEREVR